VVVEEVMIPPGTTELDDPEEWTVMVPPVPVIEESAKAGVDDLAGSIIDSSRVELESSSFLRKLTVFIFPR
jgi:hypothetical protein